MSSSCVVYKDRVFIGNLHTDITENCVYEFLKKQGFEPGKSNPQESIYFFVCHFDGLN